MPFRGPAQNFKDILDNIARIERFTAGIRSYEEFVDDEMMIYAVRASLIELSEAAIRLGTDAEGLCPGVSWRDIRGTGNVLRHGYDRIDLRRVWKTVTEELAPLKAGVERAMLDVSLGRDT